MKFSKNLRLITTALCMIVLVLTLLFGSVQAENVKYTCPMHPHYISHSFGSCPICGMDLVEMVGGTATDENTEDQGLVLPSYMVQRTGVRSKAAEIAYFGRAIRSFGEVVVNQRLQTDVSLRVEGWVEDLVVNAEGDEVGPNSLLFYFYSPQIIAAQQDYLTALSAKHSGRTQVTEDRLYSLGVQKKVVERIRKETKLLRNLPFYAEQKGRVEKISVRQGSYLQPGAIALRIQSYEKVWIQVNLAEQDISFVNKESRVDVDFPNLGIHRENVTIDYIAPTVDPSTRTAQLRLILENSDGLIRPGAYADVTIMTGISPRLSIPYESVLQNKEGSYVIIDRGEGTYQAREIKVGMQYKGLVEVQAGLMENELVVVSGQFLIDSESSLRESFQRMEKLALSLADLEITEHQLVLANHMVEGLLYVHEEILAGRLPKTRMLDAAVLSGLKLGHEVQGSRLTFVVEDFLAALRKRSEIMTKSGWQQLLSDSTEALRPWVVEGRARYYKELGLAYFSTEDGRSWVQFAGDVQNPYGEGKVQEVPLGSKDLNSSMEQ